MKKITEDALLAAYKIADIVHKASSMRAWVPEIAIDDVARAIMEARDRALEDAAAVAYDKTEDCEHADAASEWYKGYGSACRGIAESILAMKSSARPDAGLDKSEMSE